MKFHLIKCTGCELKCHRTTPMAADVKSLVSKYNRELCQTHKKEEKIPLKVSYSTHKAEPNQPCLCGSGKKFKKCCMKNVTSTARGFYPVEKTGARA